MHLECDITPGITLSMPKGQSQKDKKRRFQEALALAGRRQLLGCPIAPAARDDNAHGNARQLVQPAAVRDAVMGRGGQQAGRSRMDTG